MYHGALHQLLIAVLGKEFKTAGNYLAGYKALEQIINQTKMRYTKSGIRKTRCCAPVAWKPTFLSDPTQDKTKAFKLHNFKYVTARCGDAVWCPFCYVRHDVYKYALRALYLNHAEENPAILITGKTRYRLGSATCQRHAFELAKSHSRRWRSKNATRKPSGIIRALWVLPECQDGYWVQESVIIALRGSGGWLPYPEYYLMDKFENILAPETRRKDVWFAVASALSYPPEVMLSDDKTMSDWFACHNLKDRYTRTSSFGSFKKSLVKRVDKNWTKSTMKVNRKILDDSINVLNLDVRIVNALEDDTTQPVIKTVRDLLQTSPEELKKLPNIGSKTVVTILEALAKAGIHKDNYKFPEKSAKEKREQDIRRKIIGI